MLLSPRKPFGNEIVQYIDEEGTPQYGRIENKTLHLLRADNSGFATEIDSQDISSWDDEDFKDVTRVAMWKDKYYKPIAGRMDSTFPQNDGWIAGACNTILTLTELTISNTTKRLTIPFTKVPNCQKNWLFRTLHLNMDPLPWDKIWASLGSFLTSPRDEWAWWALIHRGMYVLNKDIKVIDKSCRACKNCPDTYYIY